MSSVLVSDSVRKWTKDCIYLTCCGHSHEMSLSIRMLSPSIRASTLIPESIDATPLEPTKHSQASSADRKDIDEPDVYL
jgi:hypothetical protein